MKTKFAQLVLLTRKVNRQYLQFAMLLVALTLMVLGVSAPDDTGFPFGR